MAMLAHVLLLLAAASAASDDAVGGGVLLPCGTHHDPLADGQQLIGHFQFAKVDGATSGVV